MSSSENHQPERLWSKSYPVDIDWNSDINASTLVDMFRTSVQKYGERECMSFLGRTWTYREVDELSSKFAKGLQEQGIGKGSTVGICLPNTPFYIIAYYGALKAGATVANFNPTSPSEALIQQINDSKTDLMVAINLKGTKEQPLYPSVEKALGNSGLKKVVYCDIGEALPAVKGFAYNAINAVKGLFGKSAKASVPKDDKHIPFAKMVDNKGNYTPAQISPDDVALLQYTGGTTGVPKGAELTHANLTSNIHQANLWFASGSSEDRQERMLVALPFFHIFAMTVQMNLSLSMGAKIVMLPKPDVEEILKTIDKEKPTMFAGVPALYKKLAEFKDVSKYDLSSLKICLSGGAPLPEQTMKAWKSLTGIDLVEGYGLSETSPIVIANPINGVKKLGSIGMPLPKTEVRFTDIDFPDREVPIHMEGEICLRGPQIMKGYFGNTAETDKVFDKDGFFHTGDIGRMDEDGYVTITDRLKDMIIVNGFKAFPKKIEEAIRKHDDVSEVIVIGIPNDKTGETVKAFVQLKEGKTLSAQKLVAFLQDKLTSYELPLVQNVEFRETLPLTQIGKPDKKPLREEEKRKAALRKPPKP